MGGGEGIVLFQGRPVSGCKLLQLDSTPTRFLCNLERSSQRSLRSTRAHTHTCHGDRDVTLAGDGGEGGGGRRVVWRQLWSRCNFPWCYNKITPLLFLCVFICRPDAQSCKSSSRNPTCFLFLHIRRLGSYQVKESEEEGLLLGFSGNSSV